ncbi:RHS repeat-associated core domain-containing protein [Ramlibacter albus]|uniref:RHS repeat protein n=1 Tax=Ramlibacter albus TaxID=2079448 RepID=A0A923S0G2_9BURK|nr:RHS repeat-associated core domain-containing protein [Ramlibacter albus]MBC5763324.1 RHS repeat protein [Ramlibacter albus]
MPTMLLARACALLRRFAPALFAAAFFGLPSLPAHAAAQVEVLSKCPASWWAASQRFTASCTKEAACTKYTGTRTFQGIYVAMSGNQYCEYTDGYRVTLSGLYPEPGDYSCPANATLSFTSWGQYPQCFCDDGYLTQDGKTCTTPTPRTVASNGGRTIKVGDGPLVFTAKVMQGTPKAGVMVLLYPHTGNFGGFTFDGTPYTDANGEVRIKYSSTWDLVGATREALVSIACEGCANRAVVKMTVLGRPAKQAQMCHRTPLPIELTSGTKLLTETDIRDTRPHPLMLTRHFASRWDEAPAAGLGASWSHNHAHRVVLGTEWRTVLFGDGTSSRFRNVAVPAGSGANWSCPAGVDCAAPTVVPTGPATWQADGNADTMTEAADRIVVKRTEDETVFEFDKATGRVLLARSRNGWAYTYSYSGNLLSRVTNAFGRSIAFESDTAGRLVRVSGAGTAVAYRFDTAARLAGSSYTNGTSRGYVYEDARWPNAVTGLIDQNGQRWGNYLYDETGRAVLSELAGGAARRSVAYGNQSTAVTDPLGTTRTFQYSRLTGAASGLALTQSSAPGGDGSGVAQRTLDANGLVTGETDYLGVTTLFSWDAQRRLPTSETRAASRPEAQTTQTEWHPTMRLPVRITEAGRINELSYDSLGNVLTQTVTDTARGEPRTWRWTYGVNNLPATATEPAGALWTMGYDSEGNRTSLRDPLGQMTTWTFDEAGRVLTQTAPSGLVTRYSYDLVGQVIAQESAGETTRFTYTASGQLSSATLHNGYLVTYSYDAAQRLIGAADNQGAIVTYTLDRAGNTVRSEVKDASGGIAQATSRVINALNQVAQVQGAAGQATQLGYDANGSQVSETDQLNQTTTQALDALRRATVTTFADNATATQSWNALDQLTKVVDPKNVATGYEVNAFGEVMRETSPDIGSITYTRNANGEVTQSTDAKNQTTRIDRDALGRATAVRFSAGSTTTLAYDAAGAVAKAENKGGTATYARDPHSRPTGVDNTVNDNPSNPSRFRVGYSYSAGDLSKIVYPSGLQVVYRRTAGRITGVDVLEPGKNKVTFAFMSNITHTALGQPRSWAWSNGDTAARTFDSDGRMTSSEFSRYTWDSAGRITGIVQDLWATRTVVSGTTTIAELYKAPVTWTAGYDRRNRLTSLERQGARSVYSYDANSNRLTALETQGSDVDLEGTFDQPNFVQSANTALKIDDGSNRLLGFTQTLTRTQNGQPLSSTSSTVTYGIDPNGSMTSDGLRKFIYDDTGRISRVEIMKDGEAAAVRYLYDWRGRRIFKSEPEVAQTLPNETVLGNSFVNWLRKNFGWIFAKSNGARTSVGQAFVYADGELPSWVMLGEYDNGSASGRGTSEYIWLPTTNGSALLVGMYRNGKFYAIHTDHLGTPRLITDNAKQAVWQWPYSGFGANKPAGVLQTVLPGQLKWTQATVEFDGRFPGQTYDRESGLVDNGWRTYDPFVRGGYTQVDPIGVAGGINVYGYANASPFAYTDPSGLNPGAAIAWCVSSPACATGVAVIVVGSAYSQSQSRPDSKAPPIPAEAASTSPDSTNCPDCNSPYTREQAMAEAYAWAGIAADGAGAAPLGWRNLNIPKGMTRGDRVYAEFMSKYYPPTYGFAAPNGATVVEHPFGHPDLSGPEHHKCPHFHAKNAEGVERIFHYKP